MRILYLHQYFNTPAMSGGTRSYEMARRLVAAGHEVHMITSKTNPSSLEKTWIETNEDGIHVHWLPVPYSNKMSYSERIWAFIKFMWEALWKTHKIKCDVVFATSTPLTIAIPAIYASWSKKVPMVFEVRDLWPELPIAMGALKNPLIISLAKQLERLAYRHATSIVALSPGMKDGVLREGIEAERVTVIPNSSDVELFNIVPDNPKWIHQRLGIPDSCHLVVYTGTLGRVNGVDYLVDVAYEMKKISSAVHFLVIGDGVERERIERKAKETGVLGDNFSLWDKLPKKDIPKVLKVATLATSVVIPVKELENNSANKFFDALAAGCPIAINHGGWMADIIRENQAGIIMPYGDRQRAARVILDFVSDSEKIAFAKKATFQLALLEFDRNKLAKTLEKVLTQSTQTYRSR